MSYEALEILKEQLYFKIQENDAANHEINVQFKKYMDSKFLQQNDYMTNLNLKFDVLENTWVSDRLKLERLQDLITFQKSAEQDLSNLDSNLKNLGGEFKESCLKYDNIIIANLVVPGIIGEYATYKNMKSYIEVTITIYFNFLF